MDFHPLPERRLIIHLRGEVEIGVSDGRTQIFPHSIGFSGEELPVEDEGQLTP
jgi:hypothetical protein